MKRTAKLVAGSILAVLLSLMLLGCGEPEETSESATARESVSELSSESDPSVGTGDNVINLKDLM